MASMSEEDFEQLDERCGAFAEEFKALVRKHMPKYPRNQFDALLLEKMQEQTSCYSPWIWS